MSDRKRLPFRRRSDTIKIRHGGSRSAYHVTRGYYAGGELGEVFIATNSAGSNIEAMARDIAILMSLALQHGCSIETMSGALTREHDGSPSTVAGAVADRLSLKDRA
jgi:hypothetical protein